VENQEYGLNPRADAKTSADVVCFRETLDLSALKRFIDAQTSIDPNTDFRAELNAFLQRVPESIDSNDWIWDLVVTAPEVQPQTTICSVHDISVLSHAAQHLLRGGGDDKFANLLLGVAVAGVVEKLSAGIK